MKDETRLFFVVDSIEDNEEIFETLELAEKYIKNLNIEDKPRIRICMVRHAYREVSGSWNYNDCSDTFQAIFNLK